MRYSAIAILLAGEFLSAPAFAGTPSQQDRTSQLETHSIEQHLLETANTPADHAALATHFRAKAAVARADAASHGMLGCIYNARRGARSYGGSKVARAERMREHCRKIAANDEAMAAEFEALAKLHEQQSAKLQ